jgi:hypothetical protein
VKCGGNQFAECQKPSRVESVTPTAWILAGRLKSFLEISKRRRSPAARPRSLRQPSPANPRQADKDYGPQAPCAPRPRSRIVARSAAYSVSRCRLTARLSPSPSSAESPSKAACREMAVVLALHVVVGAWPRTKGSEGLDRVTLVDKCLHRRGFIVTLRVFHFSLGG